MYKKSQLNLEDIGQVVLGAAILATPIAFSEEAWRFGETLPMENVFTLILLSLAIIGFYIYYGIFQGQVSDKKSVFLGRVAIDYFLTLAVVSVVLLVLDKISLSSDYLVSFKRIVVLSFPGAMGAVVVDGFDKE